MIEPVGPQDLAIDHQLADMSSSIRFLLDVTPVDLIATRRRFFDDGCAPLFRYEPLAYDPAVLAARLAAVRPATVADPALSHLLQAKYRELELQLDMLRCRGSAEFLDLSVQLYGTVSPAQLAEAEVLLAHVDTPPSEPGPRLDAAAFARRVETELDHYRTVEPGLAVGVEVRDESSGVMVVNGNVLIAPTVSVPASRANALLQHEIGTHVVTHVNGSRQPLRLLGAGLAGCDETQEGLAVFAEYLVGGLTGRRLRQLAARVVAVHQMTDGATFSEVHHNLVASGVSRVEAFTIAMRVYRSGGLTKDAVYLRGLASVIAHLASGGRLDVLWLGKMSLADVPHIEDLRNRRVLAEPLLVPRYFAEPDVQQRLSGITTSTTALDMIGATR
jgi:uncharacterized protein (TIGR02421 family)